ncbi:hypothetical protein BTO06_01180 [Tenacibaculum sp. SZ-18]|uniref:hypothetical protein n=1 Tax=Tenacibaculum sp. SZ-18 TaxID=754423 RepID=UPI000C2CF7E3|nr:hypothetical protein [Tenacibaculum sp. SZ-18]AUC13847.1 hypothetical protein BTO06_01180 [Tenacibaculum sp. SZ-18]
MKHLFVLFVFILTSSCKVENNKINKTYNLDTTVVQTDKNQTELQKSKVQKTDRGKKYSDTTQIDYLKNQKILDILKILPLESMESWKWPQKDRIKTVEFIEKNNYLIDTTQAYHKFKYIKPNTLGIQVVDGFWTLSIFNLTSIKSIVITNDIVGDGKDIHTYIFNGDSLEPIEFKKVFSNGLENILKKRSESCRLELEDNYFTFDFDFSDPNLVKFKSWGIEKDEHHNCFKGNVLEFEINKTKESFELRKTYWNKN